MLSVLLDGDGDASSVVASANIDQVLELGTDGGQETLVIEAAGCCVAGSGGLRWEASTHDAVVRNKYRMMCAMLKDSVRNRRYAHAIEHAHER